MFTSLLVIIMLFAVMGALPALPSRPDWGSLLSGLYIFIILVMVLAALVLVGRT